MTDAGRGAAARSRSARQGTLFPFPRVALAFLLAVCLLCGLSAPASAATPGDVTLKIAQTVTRAGVSTTEGAFTYRLTPGHASNPLPTGSAGDYTFTATGTDEAQTGPIAFTRNGIYAYELGVVSDARAGYTYDSRKYKVEVYVNSSLGATIVAYNDNGDKASDLSFSHTYNPPPATPTPSAVEEPEPATPTPPATEEPAPATPTPPTAEEPATEAPAPPVTEEPTPSAPSVTPAAPKPSVRPAPAADPAAPVATPALSPTPATVAEEPTPAAVTETPTPAAITEEPAPEAEEGTTETEITYTLPDAQGEGGEPLASGFSEEDMARLEAQTGNVFVDLAEGNIPLGNNQVDGVWSLLNLFFAFLSTLAAAIGLIAFIVRRRREHEMRIDPDAPTELAPERMPSIRVMAIVLGVLTPIAWMIFDDLTLPAVWINRWTPLIAAMFLIQIALYWMYGKIQQRAIQREKDAWLHT